VITAVEDFFCYLLGAFVEEEEREGKAEAGAGGGEGCEGGPAEADF